MELRWPRTSVVSLVPGTAVTHTCPQHLTCEHVYAWLSRGVPSSEESLTGHGGTQDSDFQFPRDQHVPSESLILLWQHLGFEKLNKNNFLLPGATKHGDKRVQLFPVRESPIASAPRLRLAHPGDTHFSITSVPVAPLRTSGSVSVMSSMFRAFGVIFWQPELSEGGSCLFYILGKSPTQVQMEMALDARIILKPGADPCGHPNQR